MFPACFVELVDESAAAVMVEKGKSKTGVLSRVSTFGFGRRVGSGSLASSG
jgi:hypothetical protein